MFASVRARSLKPLAFGDSQRASERNRTRANAQPCHSCHASVAASRLGREHRRAHHRVL